MIRIEDIARATSLPPHVAHVTVPSGTKAGQVVVPTQTTLTSTFEETKDYLVDKVLRFGPYQSIVNRVEIAAENAAIPDKSDDFREDEDSEKRSLAEASRRALMKWMRDNPY